MKIKKALFLTAAVVFWLLFPYYPVNAETPILQNGSFNSYTPGGGWLLITYDIDYWEPTEATVNSNDLNDLYFDVLGGSKATIAYTDKAVLEDKTYLIGIDVKTAGETEVSFFLQDGINDYVKSVTVTSTGGNYETITVKQKVVAGSYDFHIEISCDIEGCSVDDVFIEEYNVVPEESDKITTEFGAYIRTSITEPGLRFRGRVDKDYYDGLLRDHPDLVAGIIIVPYDYLERCEYFSVDDIVEAGLAYKEIPALIWNNNPEEDGYYGFNCALTQIDAINIDRAFAARTFVKYTEDQTVKYVYGAFDVADNVRSVNSVAQAAKEVDYETLGAGQKEVIDYYCNAIQNVAVQKQSFSGATDTYTFNVSASGYIRFSYDVIGEGGESVTATCGGEETLIKSNAFKVTAGEVSVTFNLERVYMVSPISNFTVKFYADYSGS